MALMEPRRAAGHRDLTEQETGHRDLPEQETERRDLPEQETERRGLPEQETERRGLPEQGQRTVHKGLPVPAPELPPRRRRVP